MALQTGSNVGTNVWLSVWSSDSRSNATGVAGVAPHGVGYYVSVYGAH